MLNYIRSDGSKTLIEVCPEPPISLPTCNIGLLVLNALSPESIEKRMTLRLTTYLSFSKTLSWLKARAIRLFGLFFLAYS